MRLAPLTKLFLAFAFSIWAFPLNDPTNLGILLGIQILYAASLGVLRKMTTGLVGLLVGVVALFMIQILFKAGWMAGLISGLKMATMTLPFVILIGSTTVQDLSAALVRQCGVSPEYAFLLTSVLRFIPDFLAEGKAIRQAQACRGFSAKKSIAMYVLSYLAVVEPLILGAVARAETMAISLEMRGFGQGRGPINHNLYLSGTDYLFFLLILGGTIVVFFPKYLPL